MKPNGFAILRLGMRPDHTAARARGGACILRVVRAHGLHGPVERSQLQGHEKRAEALAQRELHLLEMIPEGQCREEISLDIDVTAEVRIGEPQWVASEHQ